MPVAHWAKTAKPKCHVSKPICSVSKNSLPVCSFGIQEAHTPVTAHAYAVAHKIQRQKGKGNSVPNTERHCTDDGMAAAMYRFARTNLLRLAPFLPAEAEVAHGLSSVTQKATTVVFLASLGCQYLQQGLEITLPLMCLHCYPPLLKKNISFIGSSDCLAGSPSSAAKSALGPCYSITSFLLFITRLALCV